MGVARRPVQCPLGHSGMSQSPPAGWTPAHWTTPTGPLNRSLVIIHRRTRLTLPLLLIWLPSPACRLSLLSLQVWLVPVTFAPPGRSYPLLFSAPSILVLNLILICQVKSTWPSASSSPWFFASPILLFPADRHHHLATSPFLDLES